MRYQLADLNNGGFGDIYDNLEAAKEALEKEVQHWMSDSKEALQEYVEDPELHIEPADLTPP